MTPDHPVPIKDYAVVGDGSTVALISRHGSVDWLCMPRFDSPACFAALLGDSRHGRWLLTVPDATRVERRYRGDDVELVTTYTSPTGVAQVTDVMPVRDGAADLVRTVEVLEGEVTVEHEWIVRFGYGKILPWVRRIRDETGATGDEALRAIAGSEALLLRGARIPPADDHRHRETFTMSTGESLELTSTWTASWEPPPPCRPVTKRIDDTRRYWESWVRTCTYDGPYRDALVRSLITLRLLTHVQTGGIVAAATTSLPEDVGGERNWDYRYCWLRDAALTLEALVESGYQDEVAAWRDWLLRAVAGDPEDMQIMYAVDGSRELPERILDHLPGYAGSRPVRVGNAAVGQRQNDVLGEVMSALAMARDFGLHESPDAWSLQQHLVDAQIERWRQKDSGLWEIRGPSQHFVHSKVMSWAAVDAAVRGAEAHGLTGPVERWRHVRDEIHADVLAHGWNEEVGSFVQFYGAAHTDAALLQMLQVGFLPPDDPRMVATVRTIRHELERDDGFVLRYATETGVDGLGGAEHPFLACSFWLVDALARIGEPDEARRLLDVILEASNDVGLLAEEYDPVDDRAIGNFPQAFSHLGLVRAIHSLARAEEHR
ncbi:Glucoamylase (glucan-1,4-alpha-glucosidase), GH15 family [Paraoerskovia marina]|uniref:Glucoamylase (Glucan-1,4-alpha-glucosidase), GH15 family n=1 Tax=Paraoerskovia marina TaxID=545619 RepID=A0A1H1T4Q6_9CELL|nr:glycoside hydrolase family 15 protein [Paraoerskovia marina]SDS55197.1 Glucoamylase (glucan-1,4-alpha-glucosidase), GH15 family [Paraoerskovia marina]